MRIEEATQIKDGTPVRVFENQFYNVLGYWIDSFGNPHPAKWNRNGDITEGNRVCPAQAHDLRLDLHDWKDKIPWDGLQDWIHWVTRDLNESWWIGHMKKPIQDRLGWEPDDAYCVLCSVKMPEGPTDWRDAIAQRPKEL